MPETNCSVVKIKYVQAVTYWHGHNSICMSDLVPMTTYCELC